MDMRDSMDLGSRRLPRLMAWLGVGMALSCFACSRTPEGESRSDVIVDASPTPGDAPGTSPGLDSGSADRAFAVNDRAVDDRFVSQADAQASPDHFVGQADGLTGGQRPEVGDSLAGLRDRLSSSSFEIRGEYAANPDADACVAGFIKAFAIRFSAGAKTVTVDPVSAMASAAMTGELADSSGSVLRYPVAGAMDEKGELLIWIEGESMVAQLTMSGPGAARSCVRAGLIRVSM